MQEMPETGLWSLGWEDPPQEEITTHSSILAWRIPWTEEPGGLQSLGMQRGGHGWAHTTALGRFRKVLKSRWQRGVAPACTRLQAVPPECMQPHGRVKQREDVAPGGTNGTARVPPAREAEGACRRPLDESSGAPQAPHPYLQGKARWRTQQNLCQMHGERRSRSEAGLECREQAANLDQAGQQHPGTQGASPRRPDVLPQNLGGSPNPKVPPQKHMEGGGDGRFLTCSLFLCEESC